MSKESVYFNLGSVDGKHDVKKLRRELDALPGVCSVSVNASSGRVAVDFDTTGVQSGHIKQRLEELGYEILESQ